MLGESDGPAALKAAGSRSTPIDEGESALRVRNDTRSSYVAEIQGLRSVALLMVVVYHIWFHTASGGVDVFLFVSAFLITQSVLHAERRAGPQFNPVIFLVRRFARLLPLAAATVVLTVIASFGYLPPWRWSHIAEEAWFTLTYRLNVLLQDRGTDYYAIDPAVLSPFQHFWSLSVQGQTFILWALLHFGAVVFCRWTKVRLRWVLAAGFGIVFLASLAFSIWMTAVSPERAYFDTEARLWQFAMGSLIAMIGAVRLPCSLARVMLWGGVLMILGCAFVLDVGPGDFPGYKALWPLTGAALVLVAAKSPNRPHTPLAWKGLVWAGGYTYALYLTHWPLLVFAQLHFRTPELEPLQGLLVIVMSAVASFLLVHAVERPVVWFLSREGGRSSTWPQRVWRPTSVVVVAALLCSAAIQVTERQSAAWAAADPGVRSANDWAELERLCDRESTSSLGCELAAESDEADDMSTGVKTVSFIGNSHTQQFMPAFIPFAVDREMPVEAHLQPGCNYLHSAEQSGRDISCRALWDDVRTGSVAGEAGIIVVLGSVSTASGDSTPEGFDQWVAEVEETGRSVVAVRDNPRFSTNIFACGQQYGTADAWCAEDLADSWAFPLEIEDATAVVDVTAEICPELRCTPQVDGRLAFLDSHHLTADFSFSLSGEVTEQLERQLATASD